MENEKEKDFNCDLWLKLLTMFLTSPKPDSALEKEVAYLHGRLDTLEKIVMT